MFIWYYCCWCDGAIAFIGFAYLLLVGGGLVVSCGVVLLDVGVFVLVVVVGWVVVLKLVYCLFATFLVVGFIALLIVLLCMLSLYITCAFCGLFWLFAIALLLVVC